jgi:hypothetical protein
MKSFIFCVFDFFAFLINVVKNGPVRGRAVVQTLCRSKPENENYSFSKVARSLTLKMAPEP